MSRPLRIEYADAWYHVMNRGRRREAIFHVQDDYLRFLEVLKEGTGMWNVRIAAFCLMPNHYHLLVQTPDANLSRFMRHVDGVYTQRFNRAHGFDGSLFRGRYKAMVVEADAYLLELVRYVHGNPVRAGLVERIDRYRWSSDRDYRALSPERTWLDRVFVLSMLGETREKQRRAYRAFMSKSDSEEILSLFSRKRIPSLLGSQSFIDRMKAKYWNLRSHIEVPESKVPAPGMDVITAAVCEAYKTDLNHLMASRRGVNNEARNVAIYLCRRLSGETLTSIGKEFGLNNYGSVSSLVSRMKKTLKRDARQRRKVEGLERQLRQSQNRT